MKTILTIQLLLLLALGSGWTMNLYKFTQCDFEAPYKAEIIYGLGVATPISIVTGWMDFEK